ncbi:hypothetical protein Tco_0999853 [Tanacetum coccineum]
MARIWRFIEEVIMKKIEYCLFDVVVEFHREMITSQLQGKLRLYDEVRARTLFVLSSSNRGRLLGIIDLMRQKNKRMKQEGLNRQIGILQKMEFDCKLMIGKLQDSHGAIDLGSTRCFDVEFMKKRRFKFYVLGEDAADLGYGARFVTAADMEVWFSYDFLIRSHRSSRHDRTVRIDVTAGFNVTAVMFWV